LVASRQCGSARSIDRCRAAPRGEVVALSHAHAYFLALHLASRAQRFAIVNVVRPTGSYLRVLRRLRRARGTLYVVDRLLVRLIDLVMVPIVRRQLPPGSSAFPEVDAGVIDQILGRHQHIDCADPHAPEVLEFVRAFDTDYILLAGCPILKPCFYGLARNTTSSFRTTWTCARPAS